MNILLINTSDRKGGAAVACSRLRRALEGAGHAVRMVVRDGDPEDAGLVILNRSRWHRWLNRGRFLWERGVLWLCNGFSRRNLFTVSLANAGSDISRLPEVARADVLHLHWVNQGFLSLRDIRALLATGKPVVWTLHDMWAFTGICHYAGNCGRYRNGCGECPLLRFPGERDLSARLWKKKRRMLSGKRVAFVGCSRWMSRQAEMSPVADSATIAHIPNPIDPGLYSLADRRILREELALPEHKKLILFGADRLDDTRKGFVFLLEALRRLAACYPGLTDRIELVVFGRQKEEVTEAIPYRTHWMGYISDPCRMVRLYRAVDLFVIPSQEDNLPNTIMEAMVCGTPVAGFATGGIPEMVDHLENGYLAPLGDTSALSEGIRWALFEADSEALGRAAREKAERTYAPERIAEQYVQLYKSMGDAG